MDKELMDKLDALDLELKRARAYNEVQNVAHRFCWYHQSFRDDLIISEGLWAKKAPDIHCEHGSSGVYIGYVLSVSSLYLIMNTNTSNDSVPTDPLIRTIIDAGISM